MTFFEEEKKINFWSFFISYSFHKEQLDGEKKSACQRKSTEKGNQQTPKN